MYTFIKIVKILLSVGKFRYRMMEIKELKRKPGIGQNLRLINAYAQFENLLTALKKSHCQMKL